MKYMASASKVVIKDSTLPKSTQDMVMLRASQINGCDFCTDIHTKERRRARRRELGAHQPGRDLAGVHGVHRCRARRPGADRAGHPHGRCGWRVTDEAWANTAKHYDEEQFAVLVLIIGLIDASNRLGVITRKRGSDYQPGQFA